MKNILYVALAMATAATFFSACQKETVSPTTDLSQLSDTDLAEKITTFRTQVLDAKKSGNTQTVSVDQAIYLMEAAFNYYHGFTGEEYAATVTETITMPFNYNNSDEITFTELNSIFVEINNTMVERFEALKMQNKRTMMFDIELKENQLLVSMTAGSVETNKVSQECINNEPFVATDYWKFGTMSENVSQALGKCGQYNGFMVGVSDAKWEQEKAARKYRRGNYNQVNFYFAGNQTIIPSDGAEPGINTIHWSYYNPITQNDPSQMCIDPGLMNQNYQLIGGKIDTFYQSYSVPQNKQFSGIDLKIDNMGGDLVLFVYSVTYGEKRQRLEPPQDPSFLQ